MSEPSITDEPDTAWDERRRQAELGEAFRQGVATTLRQISGLAGEELDKVVEAIARDAGAAEQRERLDTSVQPSNTDHPATDARTDREVSAMIGEVRTGFADLGGQVDQLGIRLDGRIERSTGRLRATILATVIGTGLATVLLIMAVLAFWQTWFGPSASMHDVARAAASEALQQQQHQAAPGTSAPKP